MGRILGGSMNWDFFDPTNMALVLRLTSATDSGLNAEVQNSEVRGGQEHKKYANYYYGGSLKANATSCLLTPLPLRLVLLIPLLLFCLPPR